MDRFVVHVAVSICGIEVKVGGVSGIGVIVTKDVSGNWVNVIISAMVFTAIVFIRNEVDGRGWRGLRHDSMFGRWRWRWQRGGLINVII